MSVDKEMARHNQSIVEIVQLHGVNVDVVLGAILESFGENTGETEELPLAYSDRVKNLLVSLVHFSSGDFFWASLELLLEVTGQACQGFGSERTTLELAT
jgi:hypothetical protein